MVARRQSAKHSAENDHTENKPFLPMPPLLKNESEDEFVQMANELAIEIDPQGKVEFLFLQDVIYLTWDLLRLRRMKAHLLQQAINLQVSLHQMLENSSMEGEARGSEEETEVDPNDSEVQATALKQCLDYLEKIERLLSQLETRRNGAIRQLSSYRAHFAARVREKTDNVLNQKTGLISKAA